MTDRNKKFYVSQLFPTWEKITKDNRVQLNPKTAVAQSEARIRIQQLTGLMAIVVIFLGLMATNFIQPKPLNIQASFDFKRSLMGTISEINKLSDAFVLSYISSQDEKVISAKRKAWTIQLIPGKSVTNSKTTDRACFLADDLAGDLSKATPANCDAVITAGRKILTDYVFLNIPDGKIVVRSIIGER
jgi:hypothetical protein